MENAVRNWRKTLFWSTVVVLVMGAAFLRFYRIPEFLTFLSDQGRDAIILKRIVMLEKWVFVGPTTSIGNVFTGPFFYYLVAPFMLLSGLDPAGPAYGIALINTVGLILCFVFVLKKFGKYTALFFLVFAGYFLEFLEIGFQLPDLFVFQLLVVVLGGVVREKRKILTCKK
jgi:4-amino-4-deoxy-L-arabinose transferase-like glycosyltransferase